MISIDIVMCGIVCYNPSKKSTGRLSMKKRNINRLLENSRRNEVRGYNIYASAKKWEDSKTEHGYTRKFGKTEPGLNGEVSIGHQIAETDIVKPIFTLDGNAVEFTAVRNHWTPAYMTTYYRSEPMGEYKKSGLLCLKEQKCFTEDDVFVSHITLINDGRVPCEVKIDFSVPFEHTGKGIYRVNTQTVVMGLGRQVSVTGWAAVKTDIGAAPAVIIPPNNHVSLKYGFCFDKSCAEEAERRLQAAFENNDPFRDAEERFNRWMDEHIPVFSSDNTDMEKVYYYRAYVIKCAVHDPSALLDDSVFGGECVYESPFGGWFGCPIGLPIPLQIEEMKWMRNTDSLRSHIRNWCENRGYTQGYVQYVPAAIMNFYRLTGDRSIIENAYEACRKYMLEKCDEDPHKLPITIGSWVTGAEYQPPFYQYTQPQWDWHNDSEFLNEGYEQTKLYRVDECAMYAANLKACADMAELLGLREDAAKFSNYADAAGEEIKKLFWNEEKGYFFDVDVKTGKQCDEAYSYDGYFPMMFNLSEEKHLRAYDKLHSESKFKAEFGMPTVDKECPMYWFDNCITGPCSASLENPHEYGCCWNGPVWPYAFSQVLDALGKSLQTERSLKELWNALFEQYTELHFDFGDRSLPCICEHYRSSDGMSFSQYTEYFHSEWLNLFFSYWAGIKATDAGIDFTPNTDEEFVLENVMIRGKSYRFTQKVCEDGNRITETVEI